MPVRVKRVYDPPEEDDGLRVLATSYWPRGVPRSAVHRWDRVLGVPPDLLSGWLAGSLDPRTFRDRYLQAIDNDEARRVLEQLAERARTGTVTLLTSVRDLSRSHLWILKELIEQRARGAAGTASAPLPQAPG